MIIFKNDDDMATTATATTPMTITTEYSTPTMPSHSMRVRRLTPMVMALVTMPTPMMTVTAMLTATTGLHSTPLSGGTPMETTSATPLTQMMIMTEHPNSPFNCHKLLFELDWNFWFSLSHASWESQSGRSACLDVSIIVKQISS